MRLFGGQQADALMQRMRIDDAMPLEMGLVGRIVEQSQGRVEGANFDVRKHLLEYDDVLNTQRAKIYSQRDRIFTKDDLSEDVTEMLQTEVLRRVPEALEDVEGPWKLLAWLEQIQPALATNGTIFPSYTLRLLADELARDQTGDVRAALLEIAQNAIKAEEDHMINSVNQLIELTSQRLDTLLDERMQTVDTFIEGLELEENGASASPRQLVEELSSVVHVPIQLSSQEQRALRDDPDEVAETVRAQVEDALVDQAVTRLLGAVERRLEDGLELDPQDLKDSDWEMVADRTLEAIHSSFDKRRQRLFGSNGDAGVITKDLDSNLEKIGDSPSEGQMISLLLAIPQGARATFDKKTHRRVWRRTTWLTYIYYAAKFLEDRDPEEIAEDVLDHLEGAQEAIRRAWGLSELARLGSTQPANLEENAREGLIKALGEEEFEVIAETPLQALQGERRDEVISELGRQALTEVYRQLLLSVISELWVEYLTNMEALRVSIGLEAYAQRDPLVQYKSKAFEMFRELLSDMRLGVVSRMFTFRPRNVSSVQTTVASPQAAAAQVQAPVQPQENQRQGGKSKRRRRRR